MNCVTSDTGILEWPEAILEERIWLWHQQSLQLHFIPRYLPAVGQSGGREQKVNSKKKGLLCWLQAFCDQPWVEFNANRSKTFPNVMTLGGFGLWEFVIEEIKCLIEQYFCKGYIYFFFHWCSCAQQIYFHILTYWSEQASKGQPITVSDNVFFVLCTVWGEAIELKQWTFCSKSLH